MRWKEFKYLFVSPFEHHSERTVADKVLPAELEAAHSLHGSKTDGHCSTRSGLTGYLLGHNHVRVIHLKIRLHTWHDVLIRAKSRSYNKARCGDAYARCAETRIILLNMPTLLPLTEPHIQNPLKIILISLFWKVSQQKTTQQSACSLSSFPVLTL